MEVIAKTLTMLAVLSGIVNGLLTQHHHTKMAARLGAEPRGIDYLFNGAVFRLKVRREYMRLVGADNLLRAASRSEGLTWLSGIVMLIGLIAIAVSAK